MQNTNDTSGFNAQKSQDSMNIREELEKYLFHWKWFILCILISLGGAYLYLRYQTPLYSAGTTIMLKDNRRSGVSAEMAIFQDLGIGGVSGMNKESEIEILKSRKIIGSVVDSLNLTMLYFTEGRIKRSELYRGRPINVVWAALLEGETAQKKNRSLVLKIISRDAFELKDADENTIGTYGFNEEVTFNGARFKVQKTADFDFKATRTIYVSSLERSKVISVYQGGLKATTIDRRSNVLKLSFTHPVKQKAEDFLNELVKQYNIDAINDKKEVSQKTKVFLDERISAIGNDLNTIQDRVKNFKIDNEITGLSSEGEMAMEAASLNNVKLIQIKTELNIAEGVLKNLNSQYNKDKTLPQNLGFSDGSIGTSIKAYNELVIYKNRLSVNAGRKNPQILQYQNEINAVKLNLKNSVLNLISSLEIQNDQINKEANRANSKISAIPFLERDFIDIARQQEIIAGLYAYLLKKKEETAISLAVAVANAKIIDVAYGSDIAISPNKKIIYLASLSLGLLFPFVVIYIINLLDTKVHTRKDIENLTNIPFLGDIPNAEVDKKIVITSGARTSTAEAFRLIRTNLEFMLPRFRNNGVGKTIFVTSTTSGEGKSFVAINLAAAMALSGKKVLLMGMDLRAPKVTEYLEVSDRKGVTNYIMDDAISVADLKFSVPEIKGLDIIASGVIPPNPAELLLHKRVSGLFDNVKKEYDYIIVDTAPVNMVTDTLLVAEFADLFVYVTRANYLDKRMLNVAQTLYKEQKLPNMAMVLNDTDTSKGYSYGYGYGYTEEVKKPWYKRS
ncbi:MAG: capsular exopolysaccharide synthesis family protein [Polaribacter sp.]|jgi:capsular exopolysaccharide synthesis family protein